MDADVFEFQEPVDQQALAGYVKKFKAASRTKDTLIKALKQVSAILEKAPQDQDALGHSRNDLVDVLVHDSVLQHQDKNVKLYAALCLAHIFRIFAPEIPYEDDTLAQIFTLLFWAMGRLDSPEGPTFDACLSILQVFANIKFYIPLLDLENEQLMLGMFNHLLDAVTDANVEHMELPLLDILGGTLEEWDTSDPPKPLLELLLTFLVQRKKPAARRCVWSQVLVPPAGAGCLSAPVRGASP